jgi:ribose transport system substrate-binding protein
MRRQQMLDRVKIFGWDLTAQVIKAIDDGFVIAVVQQDPARMGEVAVESALTLIEGGTVDPVIPVPVTIVTKDNIDKFRSMFQ